MRMYPEEYDKTVDYTCKDCDKDHQDVEVLVSNDMYVVTCDCGYENEFEVEN